MVKVDTVENWFYPFKCHPWLRFIKTSLYRFMQREWHGTVTIEILKPGFVPKNIILGTKNWKLESSDPTNEYLACLLFTKYKHMLLAYAMNVTGFFNIS